VIHSKYIMMMVLGIALGFTPGPLVAEPVNLTTFVFPILSPRISSHFGKRKHPVLKFSKHHSGVDLAVPPRSHVRSVAEGRVVFADTHGGYGKLVTIQHKDGYSSLYAHLNEVHVNPGQDVEAGQVIGRVGSTGRSTGPHLHFEWRMNGTPMDPLKVFPSLAEDAEG
jgi:murein DD-endopeptidase MepM/ murein hydrolase activator NlpD